MPNPKSTICRTSSSPFINTIWIPFSSTHPLAAGVKSEVVMNNPLSKSVLMLPTRRWTGSIPTLLPSPYRFAWKATLTFMNGISQWPSIPPSPERPATSTFESPLALNNSPTSSSNSVGVSCIVLSLSTALRSTSEPSSTCDDPDGRSASGSACCTSLGSTDNVCWLLITKWNTLLLDDPSLFGPVISTRDRFSCSQNILVLRAPHTAGVRLFSPKPLCTSPARILTRPTPFLRAGSM